MYRNAADSRTSQKAAGLRVRLALLRLRLAVKAGFRNDQPRDDHGRWSGGGGSGTVQITRIYRTGEPAIDRTTENLLDIAAESLEKIGTGSGRYYGTAVHTAFARTVRDLDLPGIGRNGVEQSFSLGDTARYGLNGSIRTDVVKREGRSPTAPIIAVWDLKTGDAELTSARIAEIREQLGIDESVPIIEIHATRGISVKSNDDRFLIEARLSRILLD